MQHKRTRVVILALCALAVSACVARQVKPAPTATPGGGGQIANPASTYCVDKGYRSEIRTGADGSQYGVCVFPDGSECDEWAYFRGECGPGDKPAATPGAGQTVSIPDVGLTFALPASWQRRGDDWVWMPTGDSTARLGVSWREWQPGVEPEALLPANAQMLGRTEGPQLEWGAAATYDLQVMVPGGQGTVQAVEKHVLVRRGKWLCDFYGSGATDRELATIDPVLQSLLASVAWSE